MAATEGHLPLFALLCGRQKTRDTSRQRHLYLRWIKSAPTMIAILISFLSYVAGHRKETYNNSHQLFLLQPWTWLNHERWRWCWFDWSWTNLSRQVHISESVLSVPRPIVFDSQDIRFGCQSFANCCTLPIAPWRTHSVYISWAGFDDSKLNFVLIVNVIVTWRRIVNGTCICGWSLFTQNIPHRHLVPGMDAVELTCLPPFGIALLAEYDE